jgi:hypothetical protein
MRREIGSGRTRIGGQWIDLEHRGSYDDGYTFETFGTGRPRGRPRHRLTEFGLGVLRERLIENYERAVLRAPTRALAAVLGVSARTIESRKAELRINATLIGAVFPLDGPYPGNLKRLRQQIHDGPLAVYYDSQWMPGDDIFTWRVTNLEQLDRIERGVNEVRAELKRIGESLEEYTARLDRNRIGAADSFSESVSDDFWVVRDARRLRAVQ